MSYQHIPNLYTDDRILQFKTCFALEKVDGTSASILWSNNKLTFFSGGASREQFLKLFDQVELFKRFQERFGFETVKVYGEAYGGKVQRQGERYGKELCFIVFEVKIGEEWLTVPQAEIQALYLGLNFIPWKEISTNLGEIDRERDAPSLVAKRNGIKKEQIREGVVLRPPIELMNFMKERIVAKHKRDDFKETKNSRKVGADPMILSSAREVAEEYVTPMRLNHVLQKLPQAKELKDTGIIIRAMIEDVLREGSREITDSKEVRRAIATRTSKLWKEYISKI